MGGRIKKTKRDPLTANQGMQDIRDKALAGMDTRRHRYPSELERCTISGSVQRTEHTQFKKLVREQGFNITDVVATLVRMYLADEKLQSEVKEFITEQELAEAIEKVKRAGMVIEKAEK